MRGTLGSGTRCTPSRHLTRWPGVGTGGPWEDPIWDSQGASLLTSQGFFPESQPPPLACPSASLYDWALQQHGIKRGIPELRGEQLCNRERLKDADRGDNLGRVQNTLGERHFGSSCLFTMEASWEVSVISSEKASWWLPFLCPSHMLSQVPLLALPHPTTSSGHLPQRIICSNYSVIISLPDSLVSRLLS